jgi:hypothetical protein
MVHTGYVNATTMECYTSGKYEVSLEQKDFCCASEGFDFAAVTAKCCAFDKVEKIFDGYVGKSEVDLKQISFNWISLSTFDVALPSLREADSYSLKSPPDPLSGLSLLKFISVFRL